MIFFSVYPLSQSAASLGRGPLARIYCCPRPEDRDELVRVIRKHGFYVRSFRRQLRADGVLFSVYVVIVRDPDVLGEALP